jgi:hypothetical protein
MNMSANPNYQGGPNSQGNTNYQSSSQGSMPNLDYSSLSDREAKTLDNFEIGKVKQVAADYIYTEKGMIQKEKFFVPRRFADRFDGKTLWFSITKMQAESEFKREIPPGPGEYAKRYTTVEKKITEKTIEIGPSGETKEIVNERNA